MNLNKWNKIKAVVQTQFLINEHMDALLTLKYLQLIVASDINTMKKTI